MYKWHSCQYSRTWRSFSQFFFSFLQLHQALAVPSSHLSKRWQASRRCNKWHDLPIVHGSVGDVTKMGQVAWDSIDWLQKHPLRAITDEKDQTKRIRIEDALKVMFGNEVFDEQMLDYLKSTYVIRESLSLLPRAVDNFPVAGDYMYCADSGAWSKSQSCISSI